MREPGSGDGGAASTPSVTYAASASGAPSNRAASAKARKASRSQKKIADTSGTELVGADAAGFGLNRPYLQWRVYPSVQETTPAEFTGSGAFVSLLTVAAEPQHPSIRVRVRVVTGAGTSGEVRLRDRATGTVIAGPLVVGIATAVEGSLEGALVAPTLAGAGAPMRVDVEARITAGASTIGVLVLYALGKGG